MLAAWKVGADVRPVQDCVALGLVVVVAVVVDVFCVCVVVPLHI